MDLDLYFARIGYRGSREPTLATLTQLHRRHLFTVPFENLDIHLGHPLRLALPALFDKVVLRRRGGFCYELNGLFAWLLEQLGFEVELLSGGVFNAGKPGPEFDHLLLRVKTDGEQEAQVIADVGFGDSFLEPLRLDGTVQHAPHRSSYRLVQDGTYAILQKSREAEWDAQYRFSSTPHAFEAFEPMCRYQQTSPESHFTQKSICSIATPDGRVSLSHHSLIVTAAGQRSLHTLHGAAAYRDALKRYFDIELDAEAAIERLMG